MPHINEQLDYAIDAVIVYQDKVLLRKHEKYNKWLFPGGHIELGEDPVEALYREVKEETGLDVKIDFDETDEFVDQTVNLPAPDFINRHFISETHEHVSLLYVVTTEDITIRPEEGEMDDVSNFQWLTLEELEASTEIEPRIKFYCIRALQKINN